jgi:hypothetical protein
LITFPIFLSGIKLTKLILCDCWSWQVSRSSVVGIATCCGLYNQGFGVLLLVRSSIFTSPYHLSPSQGCYLRRRSRAHVHSCLEFNSSQQSQWSGT